MNKFQKVAVKLAKLERDSGRMAMINEHRKKSYEELKDKHRFKFKLKPLTFKRQRNIYYNAMKRRDIETIQSAYWHLETNRRCIQGAKEMKLY